MSQKITITIEGKPVTICCDIDIVAEVIKRLSTESGVPQPQKKPFKTKVKREVKESGGPASAHGEKVSSSREDTKDKTVFVGGLHFDVTKDSLAEYFKQFGTVSSSFVHTHKGSKKSKGYAFVTFEDVKTVDFVTGKKDHTLLERKFEVKRAT